MKISKTKEIILGLLVLIFLVLMGQAVIQYIQTISYDWLRYTLWGLAGFVFPSLPVTLSKVEIGKKSFRNILFWYSVSSAFTLLLVYLGHSQATYIFWILGIALTSDFMPGLQLS